MPMPPSFPALAGQGWSVHKRPAYSTRIAKHMSGREVRTPLYSYGLYEFELTFDGLDSAGSFPGLGVNSLQSLMGLYLQCQGQYGTFLYTDPSDHVVAAQAIAIGDGTTMAFPFVRTLGGAIEVVSWVTGVSNIFLDGVNQTSGWSLAAPNTLVFTTAPGSGVVITATFTYAFECRFLDDREDFENFMAGCWKVDSLKFRSVKP